MEAMIFSSPYLIPAWLGWTIGGGAALVGLYYAALFVKQVIFKKPGGLF